MRNNPENKKQQVEDVQEYAYVMASTLNQMINYIPLKMQWDYKFKYIYNVTLINSLNSKKLKDNEGWDKNFCEVEKTLKITDILIEQADWGNIAKVIKRFKEILILEKEEKPLFWNITGGQRPFVMAVFEFTKKRPNDIIAYMEGNTGKIILMKQDDKKGLVTINANILYNIEGLTIETAFKLMGFLSNGTKLNQHHKDKKDFYLKVFYPHYTSNKNLQEKLIEFNKNVTEIAPKDPINRRANHDMVIKNIAAICSALLESEMKKYWDCFNTRKAFGYILEEMAAFLILDALEKHNLVGKVADMQTSTKISVEDYGKAAIDEFDILLLTKTGQLINFECKSGDMSGDNAKSNKYSTYAVAGVYGSPILILPALEDDVKNKTFICDSIKSAYNSAKRANLTAWCIDEINSKLKEKIK